MFTVIGGGLNARVGDEESLTSVVFVFHSPSLGCIEYCLSYSSNLHIPGYWMSGVTQIVEK